MRLPRRAVCSARQGTYGTVPWYLTLSISIVPLSYLLRAEALQALRASYPIQKSRTQAASLHLFPLRHYICLLARRRGCPDPDLQRMPAEEAATKPKQNGWRALLRARRRREKREKRQEMMINHKPSLFRWPTRALPAVAGCRTEPHKPCCVSCDQNVGSHLVLDLGARLLATRSTLCGNQDFTARSLNRRVVLHAIDATPARWRGDAGSSPLDGASTAASSPRNDLVKNYRMHPTHWLISVQVARSRPSRSSTRRRSAT